MPGPRQGVTRRSRQARELFQTSSARQKKHRLQIRYARAPNFWAQLGRKTRLQRAQIERCRVSKDSRINGDFAKCWSGRWESNPRPKLGKLLYCHCTTPAQLLSETIISLYATSRKCFGSQRVTTRT